MKILLVNPSWKSRVSKKGARFNQRFPPLDLMYCASILEKAGLKVRILDANVSNCPGETAAQYAKNYDKIIITSSPYYKWQCPNLDFETFLEFIAPLPKENLYIYGAHGSLFPAEVLKKTSAAGVIKGEPETAVLDLCTKEKASVPGLVYHQAGRIISNPEGQLLDLDSLPIPAYQLVQEYNYSYEILGKRLMIFEGARGCPYKCAYCLQIMYANTYRRKSASHLIAEVESAISRYGIKHGYFYDENFTSNRNMVLELCSYLAKNKLRWTCQTRPDSVDLEMLKKMKQAGCALIHFGVESGSQRILDKIHKQLKVEEIKKGVRLAQLANIETACFFMFGFPGETKEDFQATLQLAKQLAPTYASFHVASPYPGTKFYSDSFSLAPALNFPPAYTEDYSLAELKQTVNKAYYCFYLRPGYLLNRGLKTNFGLLVRGMQLLIDFIESNEKV